MLRPLLCLSLVALTGACATVTQGTSQTLAVTTPNADGAECVISNDSGRVLGRVTTPGSVQISRARSALEVRCERSGFEPGVAQVSSAFSSRSRIQSPIGYAVDGISGAMWSYPAEVSVTMTPSPRN